MVLSGYASSLQLAGRFGKREEARENEEEEKDVADNERLDQLARRQVRPTKQHNEEVRELLKLMGIPCVIVSGRERRPQDISRTLILTTHHAQQSPSEAEAQCAELCRAGKVSASDAECHEAGLGRISSHSTFPFGRTRSLLLARRTWTH